MNATAQLPLPLKDVPGEERTFLNPSAWFVDSNGYHERNLPVGPLYRVALDDRACLRLVAVSLRQSQPKRQEEIARAFGHRVITQARWERRYEQEGIEGLLPKRATGRAQGLDKAQERFVRRWFAEGWSKCRMAKRLGVGEATIRRTLKRLGLTRRPVPLSPYLPGLGAEPAAGLAAEAGAIVSAPTAVVPTISEAPTEPRLPEPCGQDASLSVASPQPSSFSLDHDPGDRNGDRLLAREGLLEDAPPLFADRRNPQWLRLTRRLQEARAEVARLQSELGKAAAANDEARRPTMRGFKIAHAALREQLQKAQRRIERLLQQGKKTPKRIPAADLQTLKTEKKLIADAIKMAAYQVETQLLGMLQEHYARADEEGRTLLHAAFQSPARLEVTEEELRVTIGCQSSPHRNAALAALREQLDALAIPFPGTHLRLHLAVQVPEPVIS